MFKFCSRLNSLFFIIFLLL
ncbi:unnamed protein product [Callosobruchus maculatus]|uniref:Uncharacterized protein n=1 Tax=Callosobruchus maculatus TaxID=64391 RepID=A0A653C328_CALMS|nr:unnamed protein product [Callosobruchus maculatus]